MQVKLMRELIEKYKFQRLVGVAQHEIIRVIFKKLLHKICLILPCGKLLQWCMIYAAY